MTTLKNFKFAFVLAIGAAAAGCATSGTPGKGDGDGSGDGSGSGSGGGSGSGSGSGTQALDPTGMYSMQSTYDISQNMPGTVGVVFNNFTQAATNPGKWLLDLIISKTSGIVKSGLQLAEPFAASYIDSTIDQYAPAFVQTIEQVGTDLGQMAGKFGLNETLNVSGSTGSYTSVHTAVGLHFTVESNSEDFNFSDYGMQNVVVNNVGVTLDSTGKLGIAEHQLPLSYGKIVRIGLDNMVIPNVDPGASDLNDLLTDLIDCDSVGEALADQVGIVDAGTWSGLCSDGLTAGANVIYQQIDNIDASALTFDITGTAKAVDSNSDHKVDAIQTGKWTGTLSYSGTPAPLSSATFNGSRMQQ
ncbi:MAG TPA: hypothetical protein VMJ10_08475 [Kofleriaceae bacterium]|nr:hypothetical protein [Kofleriaceae bacterium]